MRNFRRWPDRKTAGSTVITHPSCDAGSCTDDAHQEGRVIFGSVQVAGGYFMM